MEFTGNGLMTKRVIAAKSEKRFKMNQETKKENVQKRHNDRHRQNEYCASKKNTAQNARETSRTKNQPVRRMQERKEIFCTEGNILSKRQCQKYAFQTMFFQKKDSKTVNIPGTYRTMYN